MDNNLIPPFIMREAGIDVRDVPKFQYDDPSLEDHALVMADKTIIPLSLIGVFSYFPTSRPTEEDVNTIELIFAITPENWNPHSEMFQEDKSMAVALCVGSTKMKAIDDIFDDQEEFPEGAQPSLNNVRQTLTHFSFI